jgi:hypothetical protein
LNHININININISIEAAASHHQHRIVSYQHHHQNQHHHQHHIASAAESNIISSIIEYAAVASNSIKLHQQQHRVCISIASSALYRISSSIEYHQHHNRITSA